MMMRSTSTRLAGALGARAETRMASLAAAGTMVIAAMAIAMPATNATAQEERPPTGLVIEVTPQGWLNPPNVSLEGSLPGSMRRQVIIDTYIARDSAFIGRPDDFGESVLPRGRGPNVNLRTTD